VHSSLRSGASSSDGGSINEQAPAALPLPSANPFTPAPARTRLLLASAATLQAGLLPGTCTMSLSLTATMFT
jgi:hypothetical protein